MSIIRDDFTKKTRLGHFAFACEALGTVFFFSVAFAGSTSCPPHVRAFARHCDESTAGRLGINRSLCADLRRCNDGDFHARAPQRGWRFGYEHSKVEGTSCSNEVRRAKLPVVDAAPLDVVVTIRRPTE